MLKTLSCFSCIFVGSSINHVLRPSFNSFLFNVCCLFYTLFNIIGLFSSARCTTTNIVCVSTLLVLDNDFSLLVITFTAFIKHQMPILHFAGCFSNYQKLCTPHSMITWIAFTTTLLRLIFDFKILNSWKTFYIHL